MENNTKIDLKQLNDPEHRATLAATEKTYNQITDWIKSGMNDNGNDKSAALIMFCESHEDDPRCDIDMMSMGQGKTLLDSLDRAFCKNLKSVVKDSKFRVFEALRHCGNVLDSVREEADSEEFDKLALQVLAHAIEYM